MTLKDYFGLLRFKYHASFFIVVFIALFFVNQFTESLLISLIILYFSFNIFLYGGIYTINAIADFKSDKKHPFKKYRPLPSGKIRVKNALIFAIVFIILGLLTGLYFFNLNIFYIYLLVILINIFYTFIAKHIPYLELIGNSILHPLRLVMVFFIINHKIEYLMLIAYFFWALGITILRRVLELDVKGWEARQVLKFYSASKLITIQIFSFSIILILSIVDLHEYRIFYLLLGFLYAVVIFGSYLNNDIRIFVRKLAIY